MTRSMSTRMKNNKIYSLLGLAKRSRHLVSGEFMVDKSIKDGQARLVIAGCDASDNTKKQFRNCCDFYHVPYYEYGDKDTLGASIGCEMRAVVAVTDAGFAKSLRGLLETDVQ